MEVLSIIIVERRPGCGVAIERASTKKNGHLSQISNNVFWHRPAPEVNVAGNGNKATIKPQTVLDILLL